MTPSRPWTVMQEARLRFLWKEGVPSREIATDLDRSMRAIKDKVRALGLVPRSAGRPEVLVLDALSAETKGQRDHLRWSNIWHLVDLKRAGHSPRQTELQIGSDGAVLMQSRPPVLSLTGSSAALCVDG